MPSAREVEVAAEHFTVHQLDAIRTHRAKKSSGPYNPGEDLLTADVLGRAQDPQGWEWTLVQATKDATAFTDKAHGLETLGGPEFIEPSLAERRLILTWHSDPDPDDARRRIHRFRVHELEQENSPRIGEQLTVDGRSRRPEKGWVWARWRDPVEIPDEWYKAEKLEVPA